MIHALSNAQDERRTPLAAQVESRTPLAAFCVSRDLSCFHNSQRPNVRTLGRFGAIRAEDQSNEKTERTRDYLRSERPSRIRPLWDHTFGRIRIDEVKFDMASKRHNAVSTGFF